MALPSIHVHLLVIEPALVSAVLSRTDPHKAATTSRCWPGARTGWPNWPATWPTPALPSTSWPRMPAILRACAPPSPRCYASTGAPGVLVYNASMLTPDSLLSSDVAHLHQAYDVDVVGAIVATQVAAPAMRAAGGGTILFTGGGWADHPGPAWGTVSLGKAALRPAATMLGADLAGDGIRVASITIAGQIQPGTPFSPDQIAEKYWSVMQSDGTWQREFRFDGT